MKNKNYRKTTKKDFEYFKKWCEYYKKELGLVRYRFYYMYRDIGDSIAEVETPSNQCLAWISFSSSCHRKEDLSKKSIKMTALHEMLHVLLASLVDHIYKCDEVRYDIEDEKIVSTLENFFRKYEK